MFYEIKEKINTINDNKIAIYPEVQTSGGQSGSPILLKFNEAY